VNPHLAARLASLRIEQIAEAEAYSVFGRDGCLALAHRSGSDSFLSLGSAGVMGENGIAYLIWKEGQPVLASHGGMEKPAAPEVVASIRQFSLDLKLALGLSE
jgi:hypothetical protein